MKDPLPYLRFGKKTDLNRQPQNRLPRERFVETAYWNPLVVTGKDGKARVTFKAPDCACRTIASRPEA